MAIIRRKEYSLAVQAAVLRQFYPAGRYWTKRSELRWVGALCPADFADDYLVQIRYRLGKAPRAFVLRPSLHRRGNESPPHLYSHSRQELCLYLPNAREWNGTMMLARTIVPWAAEWLLHYEVWLATGTWTGGGRHPARRR